jgi:Transcriptional regulator
MARPREFDEDTVLEAAMQCFWSSGYEATSTRDLAERMKMTPASMYNAFGDKRALFLRALDHYLNQSLRERLARLESHFPPDAAITRCFSESIERSLADREHRGCLLVNSAFGAAQDPDVRTVVAGEIAQIETFFLRCLDAGQTAGLIATTISPGEGAKLLLAGLLGIRVLARVRPDRDLLEGAAAAALRLLGLPPLPSGGNPPE